MEEYNVNSDSSQDNISRVFRSKDESEKTYSRMSRFYDLFAGNFEAKYKNRALKYLDIKAGEEVLEIGFGTGHSIKQIALLVGKTGKVHGIDISSGMMNVTEKRLEKAGIINRVKLTLSDALKLPYNTDKFDAVFMSFTLELFDTSEIPIILNEIKRVLKPGGRFGIVSMSKGEGESILVNLYEWVHRKFPKYADCRPIYVEQSIKDGRFEISFKDTLKLSGLPIEIVIAEKN